ncbi:hypothetical protein ANRL1_04775 [Anaerolineae bacterium]|nr:hypothetical protein ANRL1_04775 [Anaerolineae bacterium]
MIELNIEQGPLPQTGRGISPTHKIILKHGSDTSVFWYLQEPDANDPIEPYFDHGVVRQLFAKAQALLVGDFLYFSTGSGKDYHLHRLASNRFTLKALE